jgi:hypothetical protein
MLYADIMKLFPFGFVLHIDEDAISLRLGIDQEV